MKQDVYDAIIVGARAAGASAAMLMARRGLRVLAVDRAEYGSDTLSTHALMRGGVLQLHRWGLLERVKATDVPPVKRVSFHYPDESLVVDLRASDGVDALYAPRRTVLDRILVDAAREAGAEVEFGVTVDGLQRDASGRVIGIIARGADGSLLTPRASIVIGADGIRSVVARSANAEVLIEALSDGAVVYGYFHGVEASGYEWAYGPQVSAGLIPTNDGDSCVFVGGSSSRFRSDVLPDLNRGFRLILEEACPEVAARVRSAEQRGRFRGFTGVRGFYRKSFGRGWALVGDAGYFRDPITTHGITDAFRDAELLARAVASSLGDEVTELAALADYQAARDSVTRDLFEVTDRIASYGWTLQEVRRHLRAVSAAMKAETELILSLDSLAAA